MHGEGGVLTAWDAECRLQRLLYEEPLDAYSLHVQDFRQVAVPTFLQYKRSPGNVQEMHQSKINKHAFTFVGAWGQHAGGYNIEDASSVPLRRSPVQLGSRMHPEDRPEEAGLHVRADSWLRAKGIHVDALSELPVLRLPSPIASLVAIGEWQK